MSRTNLAYLLVVVFVIILVIWYLAAGPSDPDADAPLVPTETPSEQPVEAPASN